MQSLQLKNIYFKYPISPDYIFKNLNLDFYQGWNGLVGANGVGKTSLLKLITKELTPESGNITNNLVTSYAQQSTENLPENANDFFSSYAANTFKLKDLLEIQDDWLYRWDSLSHGERKRVQIAASLFNKPDVLIVDEPTNHLDLQTKEKLFKVLEAYEGIGILVSHDRELLNLLCTKTFVLKNGLLTKIKSNFSTALKELDFIKTYQQQKKIEQTKELKKLDRQIQNAKENVSKSKGRLSLRNVDKKDSDAKAKVYLAKITSKNKYEGQAVKTATSKKEQLLKEDFVIEKEYEKGIFFEQKIDNNRTFPFLIEKTTQTINGFTYEIPRLLIEKGDKILIQGKNGSGKTSFINYLLSTLQEKDYLYIPQEIMQKESRKVLEEIKGLSKEKQGEIFTTVTRLSSDVKAILQSKIPSPGEVRKLLIAKDLADNRPLIILDEPTNHMDVDSIMSIELALKEFQGAVIFVSHDLAFCKNLATKSWKVEREEKKVYIIEKF